MAQHCNSKGQGPERGVKHSPAMLRAFNFVRRLKQVHTRMDTLMRGTSQIISIKE